MSLVVDALKKLKHENKTATEVQAPPSMKTEYIETDGENYKSGGGMGKGLIAAAVAACVIIAAAAVIGVMRRADNTAAITGKATIIAQKETKPESGTLNSWKAAPIEAKTERAAQSTAMEAAPEGPEKDTGKAPAFAAGISPDKKDGVKPASENLFTKTGPAAQKEAEPEAREPDNENEYIDPLKALMGAGEVYVPKPYAAPKKAAAKPSSENREKTAQNKKPAAASPKSASPAGQTGIAPLGANQSPIDMGTNSDYVSILSQGQSAWDRKDYKSALGYYTKAYEMRGEQPVAGNIATLYLASGEPWKAVKTVKEKRIKNVTVVSRLIIEMVNKNLLYEANELVKYSRALRDNGELAYAEGYYYDTSRNYDKAMAAFNRARGLNPGEAVYAYSYARALDAAGKYEEAIKVYKSALSLNPDQRTMEYARTRIQTLTEYLNR